MRLSKRKLPPRRNCVSRDANVDIIEDLDQVDDSIFHEQMDLEESQVDLKMNGDDIHIALLEHFKRHTVKKFLIVLTALFITGLIFVRFRLQLVKDTGASGPA